MKTLVAAVIGLLVSFSAIASDPFVTRVEPENAVLTGFLSKHMTNNEASWAAPAAGFREQNWGIGIRYNSYAVGYYKNSLTNDSVYAAKEFQWSILGQDWLRTGIALGVVTGYEWTLTPLVLPEPLILKWKHTELATLIIPMVPGKTPVVLALQLRLTF